MSAETSARDAFFHYKAPRRGLTSQWSEKPVPGVKLVWMEWNFVGFCPEALALVRFLVYRTVEFDDDPPPCCGRQQGPGILNVQPEIHMQSQRAIYITDSDMKRLTPMVEKHKDSRDDLRPLQTELSHARVVPSKEVPPNVITMNSKARLRDLSTGEEMTFTLVFPDKANADEDKISVLAPVGTAMLGQRVGDEFEWEVPAGKVRLKVEALLYQPEAAGDFHL
jgi:regulator of nucleoside diphosphate kinase